MTEIIKYDAMCHAIAEAWSIDEAKDIADKAAALAVYAKQAKNFDAERQASEIRVRAERRCGELLVALGAPADARGDHTWKIYTNVRFQYHVCYPADLMVSQGESDNSDGQKFVAHDGANLIVYGSNNALDSSLKDRFAETASRLHGASGKVTYKVSKGDWFVISGQNEQSVFYSKTIYNSHDDQFKAFELTYDRTASAVYEPLIGHLAECFKDLGH